MSKRAYRRARRRAARREANKVTVDFETRSAVELGTQIHRAIEMACMYGDGPVVIYPMGDTFTGTVHQLDGPSFDLTKAQSLMEEFSKAVRASMVNRWPPDARHFDSPWIADYKVGRRLRDTDDQLCVYAEGMKKEGRL